MGQAIVVSPEQHQSAGEGGVSALYTVAIGSVPERALEWIEKAAAEWFPMPVRRLGELAIPEGAYDRKRGQYLSAEMMKMLAQQAPADALRILAITDLDLTIPVLTFVFGQAQMEGRVAIVSLCRLRQEFYGLPPDEGLLRERSVKEVLHELGHTFGLTHCPDMKCAMSLATHVGLVDAKNGQYCGRCALQLVERLALTLVDPALNRQTAAEQVIAMADEVRQFRSSEAQP